MLNKKKYECPKCGKAYLLIGSLKTHLLSHSNDEYTCSKCQMTFSCEKHLDEHYSDHLENTKNDVVTPRRKSLSFTNSKKSDKPKNDITGSHFVKDQIGIHLKELVQIYQNLLNCPRCPMTFTERVELDNHLANHSYDKICRESSVEFGHKKYSGNRNFIRTKSSEQSLKSISVTTTDIVTDSSEYFKTKESGSQSEGISDAIPVVRTEACIPSETEASIDRTKVKNVFLSRRELLEDVSPVIETEACTPSETETSVNRTEVKNVIMSRRELLKDVSPVIGTVACTSSETETSVNRTEVKNVFLSRRKLLEDVSSVIDASENYSSSDLDDRGRNGSCRDSIHVNMETIATREWPSKTSDQNFYPEKDTIPQFRTENQTLDESVEATRDSIMSGCMSMNNFQYHMENNLTIGNGGAVSVLEVDSCEDYCTLFKCLMCSMIFLVKKEVDSHICCHIDDIKRNRSFTNKCDNEKHAAEMETISTNYSRKDDKTFVVSVMENIYKIRLRKVYQRYYKCKKCPLVFLTKSEVKYHIRVIHLYDGNLTSEGVSSDGNISSNELRSLMNSIEVLGKGSQASFPEMDSSGVYCPLYQCQKCDMNLMTKTEFDSHVSEHKIIDDNKLSGNQSANEKDVQKPTERNILDNTTVLPFSCVCGKKFRNRKKFLDHRRIHDVKKFVCEECGKRFRGKSFLKKHMKVHSQPYKCSKCNKAFKSDYVLELHQAMHSDARPYECTKCENVFRHKISLTLHSYDHLTDGPFSCEICKDNFASSQMLKTHMKTHLDGISIGDNAYCCTRCDAMYSDIKKLQCHMLCHGVDVPYKCKYCEKTFLYKDLLTDHYKDQRCFAERKYLINHATNKKYLCHVCGVNFSQRSSYYSHLKKHAGIKQHKCNLCEKRFLYKGSYRRHMSMHYGKKDHQCNICGRHFKQNTHLQSHLVIHSGEKPFQCLICNKRFTQKSTLNAHQLIHNECQYSCIECGRKFTHKATLLKHLKNVIHGKLYQCKICQEVFSRRACLFHHKRTHEKEICIILKDGEEVVENLFDGIDDFKEIIITQADLCEFGEEVVESNIDHSPPHDIPEFIFQSQGSDLLYLDSHGDNFSSSENQSLNLEVPDAESFVNSPQDIQPFNLSLCQTDNINLDFGSKELDIHNHEIQVFGFQSSEAEVLNLDLHENQVFETPTTVPPVFELSSQKTSTTMLQPCETMILSPNSQTFNFMPFDIDKNEPFTFSVPKDMPCNFDHEEEITVTPADRIDAESESIQVHFVL